MTFAIRSGLVLAVLLMGARQEGGKSGPKEFGVPYIVSVQAKTRWSTSFKKADFDKELKKNDDCLRERSRGAVPEDLAGWDEWTFEAGENWKYDIELFQRIFGRHIVIRRYDIVLEGKVAADARKNYWITHAPSGTKMRLANRPKMPKDKEDPPDVRTPLVAAVKEGKERFRVTGEVIRDPTNVILMESAVAVEEKK